MTTMRDLMIIVEHGLQEARTAKRLPVVQPVNTADPVLGKIVHLVVEECRPRGLVGIWFFGSRAHGKPTHESDYDILVVLGDGEDTEEVLADLHMLANLRIKDQFVDFVVTTQSQLQDGTADMLALIAFRTGRRLI